MAPPLPKLKYDQIVNLFAYPALAYSLDPIRRAARLTIFQIFFHPDRS